MALSQPLLASSMGSVQTLPSGNVQVGWGIEPFVSEYSPSGTQLADARLLSGFKSYRSFRLPWKGRPACHAELFLWWSRLAVH